MALNLNDDGTEVVVDETTEEARKAAFEQISKKAILVNLVRQQMSNMPFDINLSNEIAKERGVTNEDMIQIRKMLYNPQHFIEIRQLISDAVLMIFNHTRPWDNIGYRLLPMEYYDDFTETFGKIKDEFEEAVAEFIDNHDSYLAESKTLLGKCFKKSDYPTKDQIKDLFSLTIETTKFPDINDVRLNLSGPELMDMQREITNTYETTLNESMIELMKMVEEDPTNPKAGTLLSTIKALNIMNNPEIDVQLAEIMDKIGFTEEDEDDEKMMVMDDIDDMEEDDEIDDIDDEILDLL